MQVCLAHPEFDRRTELGNTFLQKILYEKKSNVLYCKSPKIASSTWCQHILHLGQYVLTILIYQLPKYTTISFMKHHLKVCCYDLKNLEEWVKTSRDKTIEKYPGGYICPDIRFR